MTSNLHSLSTIAATCFRFDRDINGNPRFSLSASSIGIEPGGKVARRIAADQVSWQNLRAGLCHSVLYNLESDLASIIRAIEPAKSAGASDTGRPAATFLLWLSIEWTEATLTHRMFQHLAPSYITQQHDDYRNQWQSMGSDSIDSLPLTR